MRPAKAAFTNVTGDRRRDRLWRCGYLQHGDCMAAHARNLRLSALTCKPSFQGLGLTPAVRINRATGDGATPTANR